MPKISKDIAIRDKIIIYLRTALKVARGTFKGIGIKKRIFPIFRGKHVDISHKRNIYCGKNVKFEDYSEIHGLSTHGLHFGNNVTIGRYTTIRPSSYYSVVK